MIYLERISCCIKTIQRLRSVSITETKPSPPLLVGLDCELILREWAAFATKYLVGLH